MQDRPRPNVKSVRKVLGHCIEPAPKTFEVLKKGMKDLEGQGVFLAQYIMGSTTGQLYFPDVKAGVESKGYSKTQGVPVPATTVDNYVDSLGIDHVDILSIDTEGNDVHVLYGALNLLASRSVRVLEFEVHKNGHWAVSRVDNVVAMLDNLDFTCYWHLNGKHPLLRATGCMAEALESRNVKHWSNMVCVNRAEKRAAKMFEELSLETEMSL